MKVLLTALNAKYYHSCLALRALMAYCPQHRPYLALKEFTINNSEDAVLSGIVKEKADVVCFACYIWNIAMTLSVVDSLKKVSPYTTVILGGPEVSFNGEDILAGHLADVVVSGEGERAFSQMMDVFISKKGLLTDIPGLVFRDGQNNIITTKKSLDFVDLNDIPFVYEGGLEGLEHKIIYYETSRGCLFQCAYCLSGADGGVRFLSLERCFCELQFFLDNRVRQVKFIDRTFNCQKKHAMGIWRYLIDHDNGVTNFHFEMAGDLIDEDMLALFKEARAGLFQFETGIQSTNAKTLEAIRRKTDLEKCFANIKSIASFGNIHQHLDLIAGLPHEDIESFERSFNDVYRLKPEQFQLGFLKLLHGSTLRRDALAYGIVCKQNAPYDVLFTNDLPYNDMIKLKGIEEMVEMYYNSNKCRMTFAYAVQGFKSPFHFYGLLAAHFEEMGYSDVAHNKMKLYDIVFAFLSGVAPKEMPVLRELLIFDMLVNDRVVNPPSWAAPDLTDSEKYSIRQIIRNFPGNENNAFNRKLHVQKFQYDIMTQIQNMQNETTESIQKQDNFVLFDYTKGKCIFTALEVTAWGKT